MRWIMDLLGPELSGLFPLEFAKIAESDFVYTIASTNVDQLVPNMVTVYITKSNQNFWSYLSLNLEKLLNLTLFTLYVYTLASTNINLSAPNLVKMYRTIRSRMRWIMDLLGPELSELFPLEFAKIAESDFVYTIASTNVDQLVPNMVTVYITKSNQNFWSYLSLNLGKLLNLTVYTLCLHSSIYKY